MTQEHKKRVFVGGISWKATKNSLENFFSAYGDVVDCRIILDHKTRRSKGFGFVTFETEESATKVKKVGNMEFLGKMMNVGDAFRRNDQNKDNKQSKNNNQQNRQNNQKYTRLNQNQNQGQNQYQNQNLKQQQDQEQQNQQMQQM
ncbi:protein boule [Anaeramoeba flamelloides]|uniref:Protein boule n=1 Tax=Anaeramoeba flamelloides TaxID=1746091 RepID=A0ABQ8YB17_9EUKA|nr:protein boule [Anaeramoeba flamelloides]